MSPTAGGTEYISETPVRIADFGWDPGVPPSRGKDELK